MERQKIFKRLLDQFETEEFRAYCSDMIEKIPEYIFEIPSSTSYKYHNKTQCQPHGQIYHILMFGEIMNYILSLEYVRENTVVTPEVRDMMRCTPIFHDAWKCGNAGSKYTVHEHPMLAGEWVRNTKVEHDISTDSKDFIAALCESHSGQWTTTNRSKVVLPKPQNDYQFLVHLCDYLSSRSNIDMIYDEEIKTALSEDIDPLKYVLPFGKYSGKTIEEVMKIDVQYIKWAKNNIDKEPLKTILKEI